MKSKGCEFNPGPKARIDELEPGSVYKFFRQSKSCRQKKQNKINDLVKTRGG